MVSFTPGPVHHWKHYPEAPARERDNEVETPTEIPSMALRANTLTMHIVEIHNVSRNFGSVQALRSVNLSLVPGTIGLVGNNGAGKSTLLKVLLGLLAPDAGEGTILGCDIRRASRELRGRV